PFDQAPSSSTLDDRFLIVRPPKERPRCSRSIEYARRPKHELCQLSAWCLLLVPLGEASPNCSRCGSAKDSDLSSGVMNLTVQGSGAERSLASEPQGAMRCAIGSRHHPVRARLDRTCRVRASWICT